MQTQTTTSKANPAPLGRRKLRALGRKKRTAKLMTDTEFKTKFFESKSKRSNDKKAAFRKKKKGKK